jgi:4-hydroxy-tetrahydrodipicolinate synthase
VSYWKVSEREIFKHFLSIGDAIEIPIVIYNNRATSGVDMSPELLVRMFEAVHNITMAKSPPVTSLGCCVSISAVAAGCPSTPAAIRWSWTRCGQAPRVGARPQTCLRPQPCIDLYDAVRAGELPRAQTVYTELKPLLGFIVARGRATTVKAGWGLIGAGVGHPRRPPLPLDDEGRAALRKVLTNV